MPDHASGLLNPRTPWILVFAHPGHELRAHHFMEMVRPAVVVLTDGSGSTDEPRLDDSLALLAQSGARPAATFGALTDRAAYAALMAVGCAAVCRHCRRARRYADHGERAGCAHRRGRRLQPCPRRLSLDRTGGDGAGASSSAREIDLFEVDLVSHPDSSGDGLRVVLDDQAFARKLDAISRYDAIKGEADAAFERYGQDAFRVEFLRRSSTDRRHPVAGFRTTRKWARRGCAPGCTPRSFATASHVRPVIEHAPRIGTRRAADATDFRPLHE